MQQKMVSSFAGLPDTLARGLWQGLLTGMLAVALAGLSGCSTDSSAGCSPGLSRPVQEGTASLPWDAAYTAYGTQESWRVVAQKTLFIELYPNGRPPRVVSVDARRAENAESVRFSGMDAGRPVLLEIRREPCHSASADTAFSAVLTYDGVAMPGCAVSGAIEHAPT